MKSWEDQHLVDATLLHQSGNMRKYGRPSRHNVSDLSVAQQWLDRMTGIAPQLVSNRLLIERRQPIDQ